MEIKCTRCGFCCYYTLDGNYKKCKYLVLLKTGTTLCRVYNTRLNRVLDKSKVTGAKVYCNMREDVPKNYKNCPYNRVEWEEKDGKK